MDILRQSSSTRENLSLLSVMEALEGSERITQRELARATDLNLKKVNYCLQKLLEKGYVKFLRARKNPGKRAYLYILTPAGLKAKSRLTYDFLKFTLDFYDKMEGKLRRCLLDMSEAGLTEILLYGASDVARILLESIEGPEIIGIVDEDYDGCDFYGKPIIKSEQLLDKHWDGVLITAIEGVEDSEKQLLRLGVSEQAIWKLS